MGIDDMHFMQLPLLLCIVCYVQMHLIMENRAVIVLSVILLRIKISHGDLYIYTMNLS